MDFELVLGQPYLIRAKHQPAITGFTAYPAAYLGCTVFDHYYSEKATMSTYQIPRHPKHK